MWHCIYLARALLRAPAAVVVQGPLELALPRGVYASENNRPVSLIATKVEVGLSCTMQLCPAVCIPSRPPFPDACSGTHSKARGGYRWMLLSSRSKGYVRYPWSILSSSCCSISTRASLKMSRMALHAAACAKSTHSHQSRASTCHHSSTKQACSHITHHI